MKHFHEYLFGGMIHVFTDNNLLAYILTAETPVFGAYTGSPIHTRSLHITTIGGMLTALEISSLIHKPRVIQPSKITHKQWAEPQTECWYLYCWDPSLGTQ